MDVIFTTYNEKRGCFVLEKNELILASFDLSKKHDLNKIYVGRISRIMPNLNAAFVEYKKGVNGFLPLKKNQLDSYKCDMRIPVQVVKDAGEMKDAVLSEELTLTGFYSIITSTSGELNFSKKIDQETRKRLSALCMPAVCEKTTCIIRSNSGRLAAEDGSFIVDEIKAQSERLKAIQEAAQSRVFYTELYEGEPFLSGELTKLDFSAIDRIVTDSGEEFDYISQNLPAWMSKKLSLYEDLDFPLKALHSLEAKLCECTGRTVWLKSGGYLVIDMTEAMTVIDVNSGKNIKKIPKQDMIRQTNKEAAGAVARVLSACNISGIIIVDFISQEKKSDDEELLAYLRDCMAEDYVRSCVVDMTPLGLVEITRQKRGISLKEQLKELS